MAAFDGPRLGGELQRRAGTALLLIAAVLAASCGAPESDDGVVLGDFATRKQPMVLAPGWVTGSTWPTETVVALNSVAMRSSSLVEGDVAVLTAGSSFLLGSAELSMLTNAEVKGAVRADTIDAQIAAHVYGTAAYNQLTGGGTIDGTMTPSLSLPVPVTIVATSNFSAGTTNVTVTTGGLTTINPGSYNAFTVNSGTGSSPSVLRLNAGTYSVGSISLGNFARIECRGPCEIRVKNRVSGLISAYIGPGGGGNDQTFVEVKLFVEGTNGTSAPTGVPAALALGQRSELHAFTFVPNGTLSLGTSSTGVGKFIAKDVDIGAETELVTGTTAQRVLPARFVVGASWPSEVISAWNSLDVLSNTQIAGNLVVIQNGTTPFLSTSEAVINTGSVITGNLRADKIELKSGSQVTGVVNYNQLTNMGSAGSLLTPFVMPQHVRVPVFPVTTPAGKRLIIASQVDITKPPGRYRDITLDPGISSNRTILYLSGGLYEMRSLTLGNYSSVVCETDCELRIKQKLATGSDTFFGPAAGLDPSKMRVFVWGNTGSTPSSTPFAVSLGSNSTNQTLLFAGRGTLEAKGGASLEGRFIARDVRLGSGSTSEQAGVVELAPTIQVEPQDVNLVSGQNATFSVSATGTDITFQWFRDALPIMGATAGSYTKSAVTLADDEATFSVLVSNTVGSVMSTEATLTVHACDVMTHVPTPTSCGIGGCARTGTLSCVGGLVVDTCVVGSPAGSDATCDGVDNDCNGSTDEGFTPTATTCGAGACSATGITSCVSGVVQDSCAGSTPALNDTTCDGRDDDCNGTADEDFVPVATTCGVGACGRTGVATCSGGAIVDSCNPGNPGNGDDDCDNIDDDCDGEADQDYEPVNTTCGSGACKANGETECINGVVVNQCTPGTNAPNDATCNGVDDDCNGTADEDYVPVASSCGVGVCARTGTTSCISGIVQQNCTAGSSTGPDTTCNNLDEDCDGQRDEHYVVTSTSCGVGACSRTGQRICSTGTVVNTCTPGAPAANDGVCNGIDDDCSGSADEDYSPVATSCGSGTCTGTGATSCVSGGVQNSCAVPTTDSDADGTPNCADGCPNNAPKTAPGVCGCAVADTDSDGDGTANCVDACPLDAQNDSDGDGQCANVDACPLDPQNDVDSDSVCGNVDNCPNAANPGQEDTDQDGDGDACDYFAISAIAAGGQHSCAVLTSGEVICWGANEDGQLGDGTTTSSTSAVAVVGITDAEEVSVGNRHSCARRGGGQVVCWGYNVSGQLGNDSVASSSTPSPVTNLTDAVQLSAGLEHTCALRSTGSVVCWGSNTADRQGGQLGNGTNVSSRVPVPVTSLVDAVQVSAGYAHSCALRSTGAVVCWGANWYGQIGNGVADLNGTSLTTRQPVAVTGITDAVQLDAGDLHTCAVRASGAVVCWGWNIYGQIGKGAPGDASTPAAVTGLSDAQQVAAGQLHSCALRQDGTVQCWGYNPYGQLGDGGLTDQFSPVAVPFLNGVAQVAAGNLHTCALDTAGEVRCWGDGEMGQLGHGAGAYASEPVAVADLADAVQVSNGSYHACAVRSGGTVSCWGSNSSGTLGNGSNENATVPQPVSGLTGITAIGSGDDFSCALASTGQVSCWGDGEEGQLGNGGTASSSTPVGVTGITTASAITTGLAHACAVLSTGAVRCWGYGVSGQLGNGTSASSSTSVFVTGISNAVAVAAGASHSCAVSSTGAVQCWGANSRGQLGTGNTTASTTPVSTVGVTGAIAIAAGDYETCALHGNGQVSCWGEGVATPVTIAGITDAVAVAIGVDHRCILRNGGEVRCSGKNEEGQLGNGTTATSGSPVAVSGLTAVTTVSAGLYFSCAVRSFGGVYCWGAGADGQLGNGYPWSNAPIRMRWPVVR